MRGGRAKLPVLAEISGPAPDQARVWSLRRTDLEAMKKLLAELADHRVVAVTGRERLAGSVALAGAASAGGRRTALLECDLSRPLLATELGLEAGPGLHEYLRWEAAPAQILQPLALAGPAAAGASAPLICIGAGAPAADPATLLGSESFRHAIAKLRGAYDLVVLDSPPPGVDRWALEAVVGTADALLACISPEQAGRDGRELRAALRRLPTPPLGAVVVGAVGP
jgi:receptor protein-tyrosine kinase/non-specific protein-tyrosine kinase